MHLLRVAGLFLVTLIFGILIVVSCTAKDNLVDQDTPIRTGAQVEAVERRVTSAYADPELLKLGFLDVTKAPYSADPTGRKDATAALQQALKDARDSRLIT